MRKLFCLLLCLCLFMTGCTESRDEKRESISLWYVLGQEPKGLEELVTEYNKALPEGCLPVSLRSFSHEQGLAAAFEQLRPELLLCYDQTAQRLNNSGLLKETAGLSFNYSEGILKSLDYAGKSFFPIGTKLQLLAESESLFTAEELENLELFCNAAMRYSEENK